jgi:hypothetical protein
MGVSMGLGRDSDDVRAGDTGSSVGGGVGCCTGASMATSSLKASRECGATLAVCDGCMRSSSGGHVERPARVLSCSSIGDVSTAAMSSVGMAGEKRADYEQ